MSENISETFNATGIRNTSSIKDFLSYEKINPNVFKILTVKLLDIKLI